MVEIKLANKNEEEYKYDCTIKVSNKTYSTDFEKITYTIVYKGKIEEWLSSWKLSYTFNVYIINHKGQIIFTYNAKKPNHEVKEVEAYYNKNHQKVPLVIGFKRDDPGYYTYFTYLSLINQYRSTGFPGNQFFNNDLDQRLKSEDDRVNRIKFTTEDQSKYENYDHKTEIINGKFTKLCFTAKEDNRYADHILSPKRIFEVEKDNVIEATFFSSLNGQYFDQICVYFTNEPNKALLAEFINGDKKTYFSRQDKYGHYWLQQSDITEADQSKLDTIQAESEKKLVYLIHKTNPYKGIIVSNPTESSFNKYIHKPELTPGDENAHPKIALILYKNAKIKLQPNETITEDKLNDLDNLKPSSVAVYYELSLGFTKNNDPPLVIELLSTSTEGTEPVEQSPSDSMKRYWLKRLDKEGLLWTQFNNQSEIINTEKKQQILNDLKHSSNKSLVVQMELKSKYPIKTIFNYNNGLGDKTDPEIQIKVEEKSLSASYRYYEHDLNPSKDIKESNSIVSIRPFIGEIEIKLYSSNVSLQKLEHYPKTHSSKIIYVYFNFGSSVPLLLHYNSKWYGPNTKENYLYKWNLENGLKTATPGNASDNNRVTQELDKINKRLNEVDLSRTKGDGYGIKKDGQTDKDYYILPDNNFNGKRVNLNRETRCDKYCKLTHKTVNNQSIGKLIYNGNDFQDVDDDSKKVLEAVEGQRTSITHDSVSAYYHKSDKTNEFPLVIGIFNKNESTNKAFYQRVDTTPKTKWKKIDPVESVSLQNEGEKLDDKINDIHYNIGKSIMIQLDHQGQGGREGKYDIHLVENKGGSGPTSASGEITVKKDDCTPTQAQPTGYTCFTHSIPTLTGSEYVSGLRLYICTSKYLTTHASTGGSLFPIHYDSTHSEVKVYFYGNGGSNQPPLDKVPLLVEYEGTYFKPSSRDGYFTRWVKTDVNSTGDGRTDVSSLPQIGKVLEDINKDLNTIQLEETGNERGNTTYGIKAPSDPPTLMCPGGPTDNFCKRVEVTRNGDGGGNYLKVTHTTVNKGPVGAFNYEKQNIGGIKLDGLKGACNQVHVYYRANDKTYSHPLLVCITSQDQGPEPISGCKKWFSRMGVDVKLWNDADEGDDKFKDGSSIKAYLEQIQTKLSNYLLLSIESHNPYPGYVQKGSEGDKKTIKQISVTAAMGPSSYKADNYRYYEHNLKNYYTSNKDGIIRALSLQDSNPTLQVRLYISNNNFLGLYDEDGEKLLTNPLTYGNQQASLESNDPYVYFFEPRGGNEDKVPLLLKYGDRYFGPIDKKSYFSKWQQYNIDAYTGLIQEKDKIKAALNKITRLLNEIDLNQTTTGSTYGNIEPTKGTDTLKANKRVSVKSHIDNTSYNYVTHSTDKTGCIGNVTFNSQNVMVVEGDQLSSGKTMLEDMEQELSSRKTDIYNDLTVYYHKTNIKLTNPLLIKITGASGSGTRVTDLYYERHDNGNPPIKWKKVTESLRHDNITDKVNQIFYNFNKSLMIKLEQLLTNGGSGYLAKFVQNGVPAKPESTGGIGVKVDKDMKCSNLGNSYTCIKHTVNLSQDKIDVTGGLRFYFREKEINTYKDIGGKTTMSVFYYQKKNDIHVYLQESTNVPLLFRYNGQCFKPHSKENYFTKWVLEPSISGSNHPQSTQLTQIDSMLNEIDLNKTGQEGSAEQYGLEKPTDVGDTGMKDFKGKRITATRDPGENRGYKSVTHSTNNNLGIGNVKYEGQDVQDIEGKQNLADAVKTDPSLAKNGANTVTVYYHTTDNDYKTPLLLRFGNKGTVGSETGAVTPKVFYQRVDRQDPPITWKKVDYQQTAKLTSGDTETNIVNKLNDIRYRIGKSVVINLTTQDEGGDGYQVQVVENSGKTGAPKPADKVTDKIKVKKNDNCVRSTQSDDSEAQGTSKYICYNHTIPDLKSATDHPLIGGLKFYACSKHLQTFGVGGYPEEPIYYDNKLLTVTVYFYSSGHGPPEQDTVPLLVTYGGNYFKPVSRLEYFTSWEQVTVGDSGADTQLSTVLDTVNKELNSIDISKTGNASNTSYGLFKNGTDCPCSTSKEFCKRIEVNRQPVTNSANQVQRDTLDTSTNTLFLKVTHATTNKFRIGDIYHGTHLITKIKTTEVDGCNQVTVYYGPDDKDCKNPLLICLCKQTETNEVPEATANTPCKKWYERKGIDISDWVSVEEPEGKFKDDSKIKEELDSIKSVFRDYLYLEIDKPGGNYEAYVQAKAAKKVKVGEDKDENKIKVEDANGVAGSEGTADGAQIPAEYKAYKHKLSEFYNGAKDVIKKTLDPQTGQTQAGQTEGVGSNHVESSGESQDPTLYLRLQVANQVLTLLDSTGNAITKPLEYGKTQSEQPTNDLIVYFYKTGVGSAGSDTVPLLFQFEKSYFGPKSKADFFNTWKQVTFDGDGTQTKENIKTELDRINRELNEIDLTKTGGSDQREYGLEKPPGINGFQTKRITVKRQDKVLSGTTTFTYVSHKTSNGYNIGDIKELGQCKFDNTHTQDGVKANEAVAVYTAGDSTYYKPSLVFICSSANGLGGQSCNVLGYYDLSSECPSEKKYTFTCVKEAFTLDNITTREKFKSEDQLLSILIRIGIIKAEVQSQVRESESSYGSGFQDNEISQEDDPEEEDSLKGDGDGGGSSPDMVPDGMSVQSERADGRRGSAGMGAGARAGQSDPGREGPAGAKGNDGARGSEGPPTSTQEHTDLRPASPGLGQTTSRNGRTTQEHQHGGGGDGRGNRGEAGPSRPEPGSAVTTSPGDSVSQGTGIAPGAPRKPGVNGQNKMEEASSLQGKNGDTGAPKVEKQENKYTGVKEIDQIIDAIVKAPEEHPAEFYGGTGSVGGVGVIATAGAVVYKKCFATPAIVAGTKAAAKVAASAASGI